MNPIRLRISQCVFAGFILISSLVNAQSAGDYQSNVGLPGDWSAASSWQRHNGSSWQPAVTAPTSADGVITILPGDRINLTTSTNIDQVVIQSSGELYIYNVTTPTAFTLNNGVGTDIINNGTLVVSANATLGGAGTIINNSGALFIVRNQGTLSVASTNNGTMEVSGTGNIAGTTVTNNSTYNHLDFTLNLNNATFINYGTMNFNVITDTYISGTGSGVLINEYGGIISKTVLSGITWIDSTPGRITFTNRGILRGSGQFNIRNTAANTGAVVPGINNVGTITVNPVFVNGHSPTFNLDIVSNGAVAGLNYDQVVFTTLDAAGVNISNSTLNVTDHATDGTTTVYVLFSSAVPITGTFAAINLPPTLGMLTYNTNTITVQKIASRAVYTWNGGTTGAWTTSTNWWPFRNTPAATDELVISNGGTVTITGVPTQTLSTLTVSNNTTLNLRTSGSDQTLTVGSSVMNGLTVDAGSALTIQDNSGVRLNVTIGNGSSASIGGPVTMESGTFNVGNNTLLLHTTGSPLNRTNGQFAIGTGGTLQLGDLTHPGGPAMTLANNIFVSDPTINNLRIFRINGASFGNQNITVNNQAIFSLGNLTTNATGRLRLSATAINPVETIASKVIGYVDVLPRVIGTAAYNFLGMSIGSGADVGTVSLTRITGPGGVNTFNGYTSIATKWSATASIEPAPARPISLSWLSDLDNGVNTALRFQHYRFDGGPSWTAVGGLSLLQSTASLRASTPVGTIRISGDWTMADELNVLPVTLSAFKGKVENDMIVLDWTTQSEINSDYYEIQRMYPGGEDFETLGSVHAAGTSSRKLDYTFTDNKPLQNINYYRLKIVDFDRSYAYSKIIGIENTVEDLSLYPNPTSSGLTLTFPKAPNGVVTITDLTRRHIFHKTASGDTGRLEFKSLGLPSGIYLAWYSGNGKVLMKRFVVY